MTEYLSSDHFQETPTEEDGRLAYELDTILKYDSKNGILNMLVEYKKVLSNNHRKDDWGIINRRLMTLFKCGQYAPLDGPMIGVSMSIRDSDYFKHTARLFGKERSAMANIEWMAKLWNITFGDSGIWMGKTFELVSKETLALKCSAHPAVMAAYKPEITRLGRNFFRQPHNPTLLDLAGLPVLTPLWNLKERPISPDAQSFGGELLAEHLEAEKSIPYTKTGGIFLANPGISVLDGMNRKRVYQLNYRWPELSPVYPMSRMVDELVQIDEGIYLGQRALATRRYSLGTIKIPLIAGDAGFELGEPYWPNMDENPDIAESAAPEEVYGYQNNGFFLLIEASHAPRTYADNAFPYLRPHPGEMGYRELGYEKTAPPPAGTVTGTLCRRCEKLSRIEDWRMGWQEDRALRKKFTTLCMEPSPKDDDGDVRELLHDGESILQMLQRIQSDIRAHAGHDDRLTHFEKLNRLFRCGIAPKVKEGLFQGIGNGFNVRFSGLMQRMWYGKKEPLLGFNYYHGATLNLHWELGDTFKQAMERKIEHIHILPTVMAALLRDQRNHPNLLDMIWTSIGKFIFPWAGKSFEKVSGRKLSMLLDESDDLKERYGKRVRELKTHPASWPHYDLVKKNADHHWTQPGRYAEHLRRGAWDAGMSGEDKAFWNQLANNRYVFGNNLQDARIEAADAIMRMLDMNFRTPEKPLWELAETGPSPFVRMGYIFLGAADQSSILPMNNADQKKKTVFQFHYRYPMVGGPAPIGMCLNEIVEIAQGLFLGQLIYATKPLKPFHSSIDPAEYAYRLFGYFLLLDNDWEYHRKAIKLDVMD
jgi:hypothetical protein